MNDTETEYGRFLEQDIPAILDEADFNREFAEEVYAALCNMRWRHVSHSEGEEPRSVTWRTAGDIVADARRCGENYMDYYCGGNEGTVTERVRAAFAAAGWTPEPWPKER